MQGMCSIASTYLLWLEHIIDFNILTHCSSLTFLLLFVVVARLFITIPLFVPSITLPCTINNSTSVYH